MASITPLKPSESDPSAGKPTCGICHLKPSQYTCPKCNVLYCSLKCFQSEEHSQCSEQFYKSEIETEIKSQPAKTPDEKRKMMEILKRFEEDKEADELEEADDETDLSRRFEGMDIENAAPEDIWEKLTPAEREAFLKSINNSENESAPKLIESTAVEGEKVEPWWDAPPYAPGVDEIEPRAANGRRYGKLPAMMDIPTRLIKPVSKPTNTLLFNLMAVVIAYTYVSRRLALSPLSSPASDSSDREEAARLITKLVPFLVDNKSKHMYPNVGAIEVDLRARTECPTDKDFALLLKDAAWLFTPQRNVEVKEDGQIDPHALGQREHPNKPPPDPQTTPGYYKDVEKLPIRDLLLVISDIQALLRAVAVSHQKGVPGTGVDVTKVETAGTMKLQFYAGHALSMPTGLMQKLSNVLRGRGHELDPDKPIELGEIPRDVFKDFLAAQEGGKPAHQWTAGARWNAGARTGV